MKKHDLKPCPFCGGKATMVEAQEADGNIVARNIECYCIWCGARTRGYYYSGIFVDGDKEACKDAAKRAWNIRGQEE